ncbi:hypothetical protein Tco_1032873 [Tanacetum coccineum]|uniref:Uncharacterized protein n=1 Tax=Tanacetum coccineum TaxID=301880 RepID=A0ABQ5GF55_9ASTR
MVSARRFSQLGMEQSEPSVYGHSRWNMKSEKESGNWLCALQTCLQASEHNSRNSVPQKGECKDSSELSLIEPENNNAFSKSEIETQMQRQEEKVDMRKAFDAGLVVTESSGTTPDKQDTSSSSGYYKQCCGCRYTDITSTPPVIAPFTDVSSTKPSSLVTPPPINTEATTITTSLPEITPFIALQLRVARLEQEMSEVKKTDHSADVLASIKSQVPTSIKNQESEKSPKEIIRIKREQGEEKQDSTYSIRSTDKVALEEYDLKSALFKHMNKNKTANRNPANYHLYHAQMEALIADEDVMDKEVTVKVKDHKRKHDSDDDEDDDDDEGPSAGSNQGRSAKRRRPESAASGSAQPPPKDDDQSSKKPRNPHKEDSLVLLSEIPLLCQRRGLLIRLRSSRWEADVVSEHFDRDDNAGDDNEETKPDPEEIYK